MTIDTVLTPPTEQLSWRRVTALHLIPGALVTLTFVALAPVMKAVGLPPAAGLLAAIAVPTLIAAALIGFGAHMPIEPLVIDRYFNWLPGWFVTPIPSITSATTAPGHGG